MSAVFSNLSTALMRLWIAKSKAFRLLHLNYQKRIKIHKDL